MTPLFLANLVFLSKVFDFHRSFTTVYSGLVICVGYIPSITADNRRPQISGFEAFCFICIPMRYICTFCIAWTDRQCLYVCMYIHTLYIPTLRCIDIKEFMENSHMYI